MRKHFTCNSVTVDDLGTIELVRKVAVPCVLLLFNFITI